MEQTGSIISALGAGSGVDMNALANNLADAQFALRGDRLAARSEVLQQQISVASTLRNSLSILASSLGDRVRTGDLASLPSVANPAVASASTPLGASGRGTYSLEVMQLASSQSLATPAVASADDVVGAGTLTLRFGTISGASFTEDTGQTPAEITIASGSDLNDIAEAINFSGSGVTAYVAQTVLGAQLMLKGEEGAAGGFVLEASETLGEEGLAALAWEPASGDPLLLTQGAQDAIFELDGLERTSASNDAGDVAPGLSLSLRGTNIGNPTLVSFGDPSDNISVAMQDLVSALNEVAGDLRVATDPLGGDLRSDPGARALRNAFGRLAGGVVMPNSDLDAPRTLADLGLATQRDGTFGFDADRLQATLERDADGVAEMFTTGLFGVFATIDDLARSTSLSSDPGTLAGSIARFERQSREVSDDLADLSDRQETLRANLIARFARADVRVSASQSTLNFLQAQIDVWNASSN